jgi:hypothetical protein
MRLATLVILSSLDRDDTCYVASSSVFSYNCVIIFHSIYVCMSSCKKHFLAYTQKMKVGLSNHQPVCLPACIPACVCVRACLPVSVRACLPVSVLACMPACVHACLPACVRACQRACLPSLPACLPARVCVPH